MRYSKCLWLLLLIFTSSNQALWAGATTIAVTGDTATGVAGGLFETLTPGVLSSNGTIAFPAELQVGVGGVTAGDAIGIWSYGQGSHSLVARQGSGDVPGVAGANFELFRNLAVGDNGNIFVRGSLELGSGGVDASSREGIWKFAGGDLLVVRTGDTAAPGVSGGVYDLLSNNLHVSGIGQIAIDASLATTGGVNSDNDGGLWTFDAIGGTLLAREATTAAPDLSSVFNTFVSPRVNDDQQVAFRASLEFGGAINSTNSIGIWKYSPLGGSLIARQGAGAVPGVASTDFTQMSDPVINGSDQLAFYSKLTHSGSINSSNDQGIWLYAGTSGALLAQTGSGGVPGVAGADFLSLEAPLLSDSGDVIVQAELVTGVGGVTSNDNRGLWLFDGVTSSQIARSGGADVPGISGASFDDFEKYAVNSTGQIALKASLQIGSGVDPSNNSGLWLMNPGGTDVLIAREGDTLAGRTILSLDFVAGSGGNDGIPSALNNLGALLFWAEFSNGDSGLFLFQDLKADFDADGDVDSNDLTDSSLGWEARYGVDLDGLDFLQWQQEFGTGVPPNPTLAAVPEPSYWVLLLSLLVIFGRFNRCIC